MVEDGTAGKDNFSLAKLQAKFFINAPSAIQCAVLDHISKGELPSEAEVDDWCAAAIVKIYLDKLVEDGTLADDEARDQVLEEV